MDYKKLGLKCGLEIHQQLDTKKLFMNTPSLIRDDPHDVTFTRHLRSVVGESGEKDSAASFEDSYTKTFVYHGYNDTNSPIEIDEEPPRVMDCDALGTVLQISLMLKCSIVDEVQVMRKIVVDGSNTSGFQRTCLVGRNGSLKTEHGNVGIPTISVEEDSAKIVSREGSLVTYNLSRLGIPLVEIGTDPDITSPEMAKSVAAKLGMILRSTGKVKRGLGTIRQDLNVSISGGARIEIKGAQDLRMIPKWVEFEALRQSKLLEIRDILKKHKAKPGKSKVKLDDIFQNTTSKFIKKGMNSGNSIYGVKMANFDGIFGMEVQPGRRFGTELSDYAKRYAGVNGIIHSDENMSKYGIIDKEVAAINKKLNCSSSDGFVLVLARDDTAKTALDYVILRSDYANKFIPKEVRKTNPDGTTSFMRPMPGSARMYPETDCVPILTSPLLSEISLPELIEDKSKRYQKNYGISKDLADGLSKFDFSLLDKDDFDSLVKKFKNLSPSFIAQCLLSTPKEVKTRFGVDFQDDNYKEVLLLIDKVNNSEISKDAFVDLLSRLIKKEVIDYNAFKPEDDSSVEKKIKEIVKNNEGVSFGGLMGMCMKEFKGKVDGKKISEILSKYMKK